MINTHSIPVPAAAAETTSQPAATAVSMTAAALPAMAGRRITSEALLGDATELLIEHGDTVYRLRRTATGKLILTK